MRPCSLGRCRSRGKEEEETERAFGRQGAAKVPEKVKERSAGYRLRTPVFLAAPTMPRPKGAPQRTAALDSEGDSDRRRVPALRADDMDRRLEPAHGSGAFGFAALPPDLLRDVFCRQGLHSSTSQLNLSRF